jgi:uncharacterized protein YndB with AHSA1/START domain
VDLDVSPGDAWNYVMRHQQYGEFKNRVVYRKVVRPERLAEWLAAKHASVAP